MIPFNLIINKKNKFKIFKLINNNKILKFNPNQNLKF